MALPIQTELVIYLFVGCHYSIPGQQLPFRPQCFTALWSVPNYAAWWRKNRSVNNLPKFQVSMRDMLHRFQAIHGLLRPAQLWVLGLWCSFTQAMLLLLQASKLRYQHTTLEDHCEWILINISHRSQFRQDTGLWLAAKLTPSIC